MSMPISCMARTWTGITYNSMSGSKSHGGSSLIGSWCSGNLHSSISYSNGRQVSAAGVTVSRCDKVRLSLSRWV